MSNEIIREESADPGIVCKTDRTKQSFKEECDINNLMKRYKKTGAFPTLVKQNPIYGDFTLASDLQTAINIVEKANAQFMCMPPEVRRECKNDPVKFMEFIANPSNEKRCIELGLIEKKVIESGSGTESVSPEVNK